MVSTIKFDKIPRFDRRSIRENRGKLGLLLLYLILIVTLKEYGLMAVFTIFIFKGLIIGAIHYFGDYEEEGEEVFQDFS
jgi:CDP-diacylglycerol--serine O-phosphatidyltransferase